MDAKINWGILGTANIAERRFIPAIQKSGKAEMLAVGSRESGKARDFAVRFNIPRHYGSYRELLEDSDIQAVYIPLPNNWHAEWTIEAANAGKHILCEKPIAVDATQALEMAEYCKRKGVLLMEAFMYRFNPRTHSIKRAIESGKIGELKTIYVESSFTLEPRHASRLIPGKGSGALMDIGCYCVNVSRYLFDEQPERVYATSNYHPEIGCDLTTGGIMEFGSGRAALFHCSFETDYRNYLRITGNDGVITVDRPFGPPEDGRIGFEIARKGNKIEEIETDAVEQFLLEIDAFSECILTCAPVPLDPFEDAVQNMKVIDAIRKSAEARQPVRIANSESR